VARILLVDGDVRYARAVGRLLDRRNHRVTSVSTGELARQILGRGGIDIVLLDVDLPDIDGLSLVRQLRDAGDDTPIIILTTRERAHQQALGLRLGGDDYVAKPFDPEVLLARIHAVLRRSAKGRSEQATPPRGNLLDISPAVIDLAARQVFKDGVPVRLAPLEYAVLEYLALNRGRAISKEKLMVQVWGTAHGTDRTLTEHVSRLRRKLGDGLIVTRTGFGYLIPADPESHLAIAG
jgi:DNA-binding response OmpR family regulator